MSTSGLPKNKTHFESLNGRINTTDWSLVQKALGPIIAHNIENEHFMDMSRYNHFIQCLLDNKHRNKEDLKEIFINECRNHQLKGDEAIFTTGAPLLFCTAVEKDVFIGRMRVLIDDLGDEFEESRFFEALNRGTLTAKQKKLRLKPYLVWSSWNHEANNGIPFQYLVHHHPDEVRYNHALQPPKNPDSSLVLLIYKIPFEKYRPTIADAEDYPFFRPTNPDIKEHGWTCPNNPTSVNKTYIIKERPEVVHDSILLEHICMPVKILKSTS